MVRVYNAHSGKPADINPDAFLSLAELKQALASPLSIPSSRQIIMTSRATQLRMPNLPLESELYLFDRLFLANPGSTPPVSSNPLLPLNLQPFPSITALKPTQVELVDLFVSRAQWSSALLARADVLHTSLLSTLAEVAVITRAVDVAMAHLTNHLQSIQTSFNDVLNQAASITHDSTSTDWQLSLGRLQSLSVLPTFGGGTLASWLDQSALPSPQDIDPKNTRDRVRDIKFVSDTVAADADNLRHDISDWAASIAKDTPDSANSPAILEDIRAIAHKIRNDAEYVSDLPNTPASMRSILRMASLHQREYLPGLASALSDLWELNRTAQGHKVTIQIASLKHLYTLSQVQSRASPIRPDIASVEHELEQSSTALAALKHMHTLPLTYGALLVESVRRQEWTSNVKTLSSHIAEDFAAFRDTEVKRRQKWVKRFPFLASASITASASVTASITGSMSIASVELNLVSRDDIVVSRDDVLAYIGVLRKQNLHDVATEVKEMFDQLDNVDTNIPRRFTDTDTRELVAESTTDHALVAENQKLQDKVRSYESRVRRLEDLLHQQYRAPPPSTFVSQHSAPIEHAIAPGAVEMQQVKLQMEKQQKQMQEYEANLQDIEVVKQDLLANLSQQESEFQRERKSLNEEISSLKARIYAMEDEEAANMEHDDKDLIIANLEHELALQSKREMDLENIKIELDTEIRSLRDTLKLERDESARVNLLLTARTDRAKDLTQRLYTSYRRSRQLMQALGIVYTSSDKMTFSTAITDDPVYKLLPRDSAGAVEEPAERETSIPDIDVLYWTDVAHDDDDDVEDDGGEDSVEAELYAKFTSAVTLDHDELSQVIRDRVRDAEFIAGKWNKMARLYREKARRAKREATDKIAYKSFKPGDLALFLPTSSKVDDANHVWAAFNDGAPNCFLRHDESDPHNLAGKQYLVARIVKMAEDVQEDTPPDECESQKRYVVDVEHARQRRTSSALAEAAAKASIHVASHKSEHENEEEDDNNNNISGEGEVGLSQYTDEHAALDVATTAHSEDTREGVRLQMPGH
ncbi:autophagy-related protein 11-domain-containing protein [Lipomyces arxii]|uniref:autophagy-related protein 11-domain-containing protein n=1 Tax=Lipomyces arxii TaxID=56418 RepID=UPI0034CDBE38